MTPTKRSVLARSSALLARELHIKRRQTEVSAFLIWQHWCHRQASNNFPGNAEFGGSAIRTGIRQVCEALYLRD